MIENNNNNNHNIAVIQNDTVQKRESRLRTRTLIISALYYLNSGFNIYIAFISFQHQKTYFILYLSFSVLTFFIQIIQVYKKLLEIKFVIQDLAFIGFFYIGSQRVKTIKQEFALSHIFNRIPLLIITQLISFFLLNYIEDMPFPWYIIAIHYASFLLNVTMYMTWLGCESLLGESKQFMNKFIASFFSQLVATGANIITLASFLEYVDSHNTNLGVYFMVLKEFNLFIYQFLTPYKSSENSYSYRIFVQFFISIFQTTRYPHLSIKDSYNVQNRNISLVGYLNMLVLLIILLLHSHSECIEILVDFDQQDTFHFIKLINTILSILLIIAYLICYTKRTYTFLFRSQFFVITDKNDALKVISFLQKDQNQTKLLHIDVLKEKQLSQNSEILEEDGLIFCKESCMINYALLQDLSYSKKNHVHIIENTKNINICDCYLLKMVFEEEIIFEEVVSSVIKMIHLYEKLNLIQDKILFERFERGYAFSKFNNLLEEEQKLSKHIQIKSQVLQITCYQKHIKDLMIYSPQAILYDLYDE